MKKLTSVILSVALIFTLSAPAFAAGLEGINEAQMQSEVQRQVDEIMEMAQDQLAELDASYARVYRKYLTELYTQAILNDNGATSRGIRYYVSNGGVATYVTYDEPTGDRFEIAVTMLERQRTLDYILDKTSFSVFDIIKDALGYIPVVGEVMAAFFTFDSYVSSLEISSIRNAGGYTMIENVVCTSYPYDTGVSMVRGWDQHPYFYPHPSGQNLKVTTFPAYGE
jgi:hypothetical protein